MDSAVEYFNGDELPASVWKEKYGLRDKEDSLVEQTPDCMHRRIAREIARVEYHKFKKPFNEDYVYSLLKDFGPIIPQGSPMYGIGNPAFVSISNCFVVKPPSDSYGGIMLTDQQMVQLCKRRGGVGTDLSAIRPDNLPTTNSARRATGILPFMERFSNSIREVGQNGRRGALMLTLSVHHPQVVDFTRVKLDPSKVTGANVSIRLTDEFLKAVKEDKEYEQRWPVDGDKPKFSRRVKAREVWKEIITCAHARAEPGLLFWDQIIRESPADCYSAEGYQTISTNPCCFNENQNVYVITEQGVKEIKQVTENDRVWVDDIKEWKSTSGYFKAGQAEVFRVEFSNGSILETTANHKLLKAAFTRNGTKMQFTPGELTELAELHVGDKVVAHYNEPQGISFGSFGDRDDGILLGWMVGDGCLSYHTSSNTHPHTYWDFWKDDLTAQPVVTASLERKGFDLAVQQVQKYSKMRIQSGTYIRKFAEVTCSNYWLLKSNTDIHPIFFSGSEEFLVGYLSAYFSADGTVHAEDCNRRYCVQLASINRNRLEQVRNLLLMFGIKSSIGLMRAAGKAIFSGGKKYDSKDCFRLTITGITNLKKFYNRIGFIAKPKQDKLESIVSQTFKREEKCWGFATIRKITSIGVKPVGCIEVEEAHRFTANGMISGNSELPLSILDSCRLLVVNLFCCVSRPFKDSATFNWEKLKEFAGIGQRLMDDLVDLEIECVERIIAKIDSDPEDTETKVTERAMWETVRVGAINGRRTGLGITALGDAMAAVRIGYGSDESIEFTERVYKTLKLAAYRSSVDMAKELGAFPVWEAKKEKNCPFLTRIGEEDPKLYADMQKYGRRNIALLTTAPAGSLSILTGPAPYFGSTSGIEPLFRDEPYTRRKKINHAEKGARVDFIDGQGDKWTEYPVYHSKLKMWMEVTGETDWKKSPYHGCCAEDLDWKQRVKLQAAAQRHIDHAISSTLNLPENVTVEKVAEIYETAWEAGCKGITVYRDKCRDGVLVDSKPKMQGITKTTAQKRPTDLPCDVFHTTVKGEPCVALVGTLNGDPYEVFAVMGKCDIHPKLLKGVLRKEKRGSYLFIEGGEAPPVNLSEALTDEQAAITRLASTALRHGADTAFVVHQLEKVKGAVNGFAKAMARTLKKYLKDGTKVTGEKCGRCESPQLVRQEGCVTCKECGWSKCS